MKNSNDIESIVADVLIDGVSLEGLILDNKLGYRYDGGKKLSWCK